MIDGLKLNQLLAGYPRQAAGRPQGARERPRWRSARFFLDHRGKIDDIEINPLMVRPQGAVAVDVRVPWRKEN